MSDLVGAYREAGGDAEVDAAPWARALEGACARGREAHPELAVADQVFVAHLARAGTTCGAGLVGLHVEDLYLACACLTGSAAAVSKLRASSRRAVLGYLRRIDGADAVRDEIEQRLWDALLVGDADGPKLARYAGRGALSSFVAIVAQRIALMSLRHERAERRVRHEVGVVEQLEGLDPELAAIGALYRVDLQEAVVAGIAALDARAKTVFRMHLVDGLTLQAIAKVYGVTHPTILRWLDSARQSVLAAARGQLRATLGISSTEFESLTRLLASQLDVDITRAFGETAKLHDAGD